ncbi:MAG: type II toxin-antitoxin system HicB family antitoxin [Deinococcota bacterium]|jgi:predicted HicB family RNase H-like nuclease|nr:type II toxin-antitoxin system HicB family antitoxin [Deinococcota bacterium]
MEHRGYYGSARLSEEDGVFWGKLEYIRDKVVYEADTVTDLRAAFVEAVDGYLASCQARGVAPNVPFRGSFNVRTSPDLHRRAALHAERSGKRLNAVVNEALEGYLSTRS